MVFFLIFRELSCSITSALIFSFISHVKINSILIVHFFVVGGSISFGFTKIKEKFFFLATNKKLIFFHVPTQTNFHLFKYYRSIDPINFFQKNFFYFCFWTFIIHVVPQLSLAYI